MCQRTTNLVNESMIVTGDIEAPAGVDDIGVVAQVLDTLRIMRLVQIVWQVEDLVSGADYREVHSRGAVAGSAWQHGRVTDVAGAQSTRGLLRHIEVISLSREEAVDLLAYHPEMVTPATATAIAARVTQLHQELDSQPDEQNRHKILRHQIRRINAIFRDVMTWRDHDFTTLQEHVDLIGLLGCRWRGSGPLLRDLVLGAVLDRPEAGRQAALAVARTSTSATARTNALCAYAVIASGTGSPTAAMAAAIAVETQPDHGLAPMVYHSLTHAASGARRLFDAVGDGVQAAREKAGMIDPD